MDLVNKLIEEEKEVKLMVNEFSLWLLWQPEKTDRPLKAFYENLTKRVKKKMVALMALMRKITIIANAKRESLQT